MFLSLYFSLQSWFSTGTPLLVSIHFKSHNMRSLVPEAAISFIFFSCRVLPLPVPISVEYNAIHSNVFNPKSCSYLVWSKVLQNPKAKPVIYKPN